MLATCCLKPRVSMKKIVSTITIMIVSAPPGLCSDWVEEDNVQVQRPAPLIQEEIETDTRFAAQQSALIPILSAFEKVAVLEKELYGKTSPDDNLPDRVDRLEKTVFGKAPQPGNIIERIERLLETITIAPDVVSKLRSDPSMLKGPPSVFSKFGRGLRKAFHMPKRMAESSGRLLTSPEFAALLLGTGAMVGAYFLSRNLYSSPRVRTYERGCSGEANCNWCRNCHACHYCHDFGGKCGVCLHLY